MMTPILLILAVFFHINGISCDGELTTYPVTKQFCDKDAFITSKPIDGKVFLMPFMANQRQGDWYQASAFCANNCADMVTIDSLEQNTQLVNLWRSIGVADGGIWLGGTVQNTKPITNWYNGKPVTFTQTIIPGYYKDVGLSGLFAGFVGGNGWGNAALSTATGWIGCQRSEGWTACE